MTAGAPGARIGIALVAAVGGAAMIGGAFAPWRDLSPFGLGPIRLSGTGLSYLGQRLGVASIGWVLVALGAAVLLGAVGAAVSARRIGAAVVTACGTVGAVAVAVAWIAPGAVLGGALRTAGLGPVDPGALPLAWGMGCVTAGAVLAVAAGVLGLARPRTAK